MSDNDLLRKYLINNEIEALKDTYFSNESNIGTKRTTYPILKNLIIRLIKIILEKE